MYSLLESTYSGSGLDGLFLQALQLLLLAHVSGHGDDLYIAIVLFQPGDNDGCIQSAGIGKDDFFDILFHNCASIGFNDE